MSLNTRLLFALLGFPLLVYALMSMLLVIQSDTQAREVQQERLENAANCLRPVLQPPSRRVMLSAWRAWHAHC